MILTKDQTVIDIGNTTSFSGVTGKIQASVMTGNGSTFSQTWPVATDSRTFKFSGIIEERLALLLDFHLNQVNGISESFLIEEDDGTSYLCRFTDKRINYDSEDTIKIVKGQEAQTYNVSFSIKKENA